MELEQQFDQNWKLIPPKELAMDHSNGCFECNICLDAANDPVVTLCGHLYCWPCIYKWFYIQSSSLPSDEYPQCPVCKAEISHTTVVPLYGRGQSQSIPKDEPKSTLPDTVIPPRPPACGTRALLNAASQPEHQLRPYRHNPYQAHLHQAPEEEPSSSSSSLFDQTGDTVGNVFQPVVGLLGEMVYARVFGDSQNLDTYPNPYHYLGNSSPRSRRQEMQVEKSLSRISLFLLCCFLLCLFLF